MVFGTQQTEIAIFRRAACVCMYTCHEEKEKRKKRKKD
jgi:hypothetical protein